jgi:hypothetical protein
MMTVDGDHAAVPTKLQLSTPHHSEFICGTFLATLQNFNIVMVIISSLDTDNRIYPTDQLPVNFICLAILSKTEIFI